jgi:hypothetical protein
MLSRLLPSPWANTMDPLIEQAKHREQDMTKEKETKERIQTLDTYLTEHRPYVNEMTEEYNKLEKEIKNLQTQIDKEYQKYYQRGYMDRQGLAYDDIALTDLKERKNYIKKNIIEIYNNYEKELIRLQRYNKEGDAETIVSNALKYHKGTLPVKTVKDFLGPTNRGGQKSKKKHQKKRTKKRTKKHKKHPKKRPTKKHHKKRHKKRPTKKHKKHHKKHTKNKVKNQI